MSELCLRSFNSINSCWWWTSNRKVWCLLLFFDGKPDRIYLSCRLSLAVQRSLALPKLKTHKGLKEVSGGGETCLRCPLFLPGHQTEAFAAGVQEPPRATVQFYFSCIVHSSCKRKPSSSASCFQKGYFTNMGLATEVHLPNAAVWLLRFITSYQTSCRTDHLFVNCHLDGLYWPVIFFFSPSKHTVTISLSGTRCTWLSVSSVGFAAVPIVVKSLSPLFLVLPFFRSRIQFPVSWRTMEFSRGTKCADIMI